MVSYCCTRRFQTLYGRTPTYVAAGSTAAGYLVQQALQAAFDRCNISLAQGDVKKLLYTSSGVLNCSDNQNNGRLRVLAALSALSVDTFFGPVTFNKVRQNYAGSIKMLQVRAAAGAARGDREELRPIWPQACCRRRGEG